MKYYFVCTNYNNSHHSVEAIESLNAGILPPTEIVIVDNASEQGEREVLRDLKARHANVTIIENCENVGYFKGLNIGIAAVRAGFEPTDGLVVGNNDLKFPTEFGQTLKLAVNEASRLSSRPVISPYIETLDGLPQNPHVVAGISRVRELTYDLYYSSYFAAKLIKLAASMVPSLSKRGDELGHEFPGYIYQGHGSCYILTKCFLDQFDELWAPTFLMGEEYFLSRQLSEMGEMVYFDPRVRVLHRCNGSIQNVPRKRVWRIAAQAHSIYRRYVKPWQRQDASGLAQKLAERDRQTA